MVYLTRRERFSAAHRLYHPGLSEEENERVFGPCANPNYHGHNYELFVTVRGEPDPQTGLIMNLKELSQLIRREVIEYLDHRNLNEEVPFLQGIVPSCENVAKAIFHRLQPLLHGCALHSVKLVETENNFAEYFGTEAEGIR
ncbi:MAG: 6-carboxytetrahydropterin synthase [Chitinophagales bacterium]|nr:6-carboxytetrahydropterin synthase [Chitinophagales bacterium]MDW8428309.1 6-carboxytetrahydropterin synthase [Chitinophagales bacterium]